MQNAYVVNDVAVAAERMVELMGAGPFFIFEHIPLSECLYRGAASELDHTSAYGQCGNVMMELVQQNNDGPSAFRDLYKPGEEGLHHMATFSEELDTELSRYADMGFPTATLATTETGTRFAYVDTSAVLGHMVELYQEDSGIRDFYAMVAAAAENWDGTDPVRTLVG
ncbi:MAG: VOC family protein [Halieaceae bacterium]